MRKNITELTQLVNKITQSNDVCWVDTAIEWAQIAATIPNHLIVLAQDSSGAPLGWVNLGTRPGRPGHFLGLPNDFNAIPELPV